MDGMIRLYYQTLSSRVLEALTLVRDVLKGNDLPYRRLSSKNISVSEKLAIEHDIFIKYRGVTISEYIDNGYIPTNSSDRFVFMDLDDDDDNMVSVLNFSFPHAVNNDVCFINCFIINTSYEMTNSYLFEIFFKIVRFYMSSYCYEHGNIYYQIHQKYDIGILLGKTAHRDADFVNKQHQVDLTITIIKFIDTIFNLKFPDFEQFYTGLTGCYGFKLTQLCKNKEAMKKLYEYAIEENPTEEDYIAIFDIFH